MPVPPLVSTASTPSATAARSASPTGAPSGTTIGPSTSKPSARRPSTRIGPLRSAYTPAAARFDATITRARRAAGVPSGSLTGPLPHAGLAALLADHPYPLDRRGRVHGLDHVDQREPG